MHSESQLVGGMDGDGLWFDHIPIDIAVCFQSSQYMNRFLFYLFIRVLLY